MYVCGGVPWFLLQIGKTVCVEVCVCVCACVPLCFSVSPAVGAHVFSDWSIRSHCWLSHAAPCEAFAGVHSNSSARKETCSVLSWSDQHWLFCEAVWVRLSDTPTSLPPLHARSLTDCISCLHSWPNMHYRWQQDPSSPPVLRCYLSCINSCICT